MCGEPGAQVDHIHPRALGGGNDDGNLQLLCLACHAIKTRRDMAAIRKLRKARQRAEDRKPTTTRNRWKRLVGGGVVDREADDARKRKAARGKG